MNEQIERIDSRIKAFIRNSRNQARDVVDIPFIGPYLEERLNTVGVYTTADLVKRMSRKRFETTDQHLSRVRDFLTKALKNRRVNQCVRRMRYQVRQYNYNAFAALILLLIHLQTIPRKARELLPLGRSVEVSSCGCMNRGDCLADGWCIWDPQGQQCVPQTAIEVGFQGSGNHSGQSINTGGFPPDPRAPFAETLRPDSVYSREIPGVRRRWLRPDR